MLREHAGSIGLGIAGFTWLTAAASFTIAEGGRDHVHSFADGLWWSAATITTVGYGDIYPVTPAGRLIGGFTMVVGISIGIVVGRPAVTVTRSSSAASSTGASAARASAAPASSAQIAHVRLRAPRAG